jgi:hypothetical protein
VVPSFTVFHTPPDAEATYHVAGSVGSTAKSAMRPDVTAGPISRRASPRKVEAVKRESCAWTAGAARSAASTTAWKSVLMVVWSGRGRWMSGWIGTTAGGTDKLDPAATGGNVAAPEARENLTSAKQPVRTIARSTHAAAYILRHI